MNTVPVRYHEPSTTTSESSTEEFEGIPSSASSSISILGSDPGSGDVDAVTTALRPLDVGFFLALGQRPLVLRSHKSHRGPTGRQITYPRCDQWGREKYVQHTCPNPTSMWFTSR